MTLILFIKHKVIVHIEHKKLQGLVLYLIGPSGTWTYGFYHSDSSSLKLVSDIGGFIILIHWCIPLMSSFHCTMMITTMTIVRRTVSRKGFWSSRRVRIYHGEIYLAIHFFLFSWFTSCHIWPLNLMIHFFSITV